MPSTLAWLDHDGAAQERTRRILSLFREQGTVDQLGLGGIRDSFADLLFPGTSTIQTRLRYFLFVPWIYRELEEQMVSSRLIAAKARERELGLTVPLLSAREEGVFGKTAGNELKRLPSEVYWGGLGKWGIRRFEASRGRYHAGLDEVYRRRKEARVSSVEGDERAPGTVTWHTQLPSAPVTPEGWATLSLTPTEAGFIRDRIVGEHQSSLLGWLTLHPMRGEVSFPWDHPQLPEMTDEHRRILAHARLFSEVMQGAPILYNWMLAEEAARRDLIEEYSSAFSIWADGLERRRVESWDLPEMFGTVRRQGSHGVSPASEDFVARWVAAVRDRSSDLPTRTEVRALIQRREMLLKGARSLFRNRKALEERYKGGLGMGRLDYRWSTVQVLLNDLYDGLQAA